MPLIGLSFLPLTGHYWLAAVDPQGATQVSIWALVGTVLLHTVKDHPWIRRLLMQESSNGSRNGNGKLSELAVLTAQFADLKQMLVEFMADTKKDREAKWEFIHAVDKRVVAVETKVRERQ